MPVNRPQAQKMPGEFLGKGAVVIAGAERPHEPHPEGGLEMAPLAPAAHVGKGVRAIGPDDLLELRGDLAMAWSQEMRSNCPTTFLRGCVSRSECAGERRC